MVPIARSAVFTFLLDCILKIREILKHKICLFTISFSKNHAQLRRKKQSALENRLKILESNLNSNQMSEEYNDRKAKPEEIYDNISEGAKVRIQILCYEEVEKSSKYLLHL